MDGDIERAAYAKRTARRKDRLAARVAKAERGLDWYLTEEAGIRAHSGDASYEFHLTERRATLASVRAEATVWGAI